MIKESLYTILQMRYTEMVKGCASENRINSMMQQVVLNCSTWPNDKTGRWVGYVQCLLIEVEKVTTINEERDFTRPLFHELYTTEGLDIPASIEI